MVDVCVVVCLQIDGQDAAVKFGIQIVYGGAVAFHFDAVVSLRVDDVHTAEVGDVAEVEGDADAFLDDVLLPLFGFCCTLLFSFHLVSWGGATACAQHK